MGKFFPQKDPFQDSEITFPLACKLPTEKVLTDFTCFSWEVAFTRGLQPSSWGLRAQALLAWSHGCAFPAASASEKQKWQTWSGQCSHQMWILPAEKLNHLIKTSLSKLHFLLEKKIKSLKPTQEKICVSKQCQLTISAPWQVTMLLSLTEPSACLLWMQGSAKAATKLTIKGGNEEKKQKLCEGS